MRRALLLAAIAMAVMATAAVAATSARPTLRLVDRAPVTVSGRGFEAQEAVRVRLTVEGRTAMRRVVASPAGAFRARFTFSVGRCQSFALQAFGSAGSRARLFVTAPLPDCSSDE